MGLSMSKVKIYEIATLNAESFSSKTIPHLIKYLDTGSLNEGVIDYLQLFDTQKDNVPSRAQRKVTHNTILYSSVRPRLHHYGILNDPIPNLVVSTGFITIDANIQKVNPYFLYYKLTVPDITEHLARIADTAVTSYPSISPSDIGDLEINLPDIDTQDKIANAIKAIDDKIANNNAIFEQLEAMAKTIYNYWFLQFEFPDAEGKPYKSSGGEMVWNDELQREIPKGWKVGTFSTLIESTKSGDWGKENKQGNYTLPVTCIRGADIGFILGKNSSTPPNRFILKKNSNKLLQPYDIVIEISGGSPTQSTGRCAGTSPYVFKRFDKEIVCSNFCKAITLKKPEFYYYFLQTWSLFFENNVMFNWEGKTSGIKNLMFDAMAANTKIILPSQNIINDFFKLSSKLEAQQQNLLNQNQKLTSLRNFLLPLLMNGQVTVGK